MAAVSRQRPLRILQANEQIARRLLHGHSRDPADGSGQREVGETRHPVEAARGGGSVALRKGSSLYRFVLGILPGLKSPRAIARADRIASGRSRFRRHFIGLWPDVQTVSAFGEIASRGRLAIDLIMIVSSSVNDEALEARLISRSQGTTFPETLLS